MGCGKSKHDVVAGTTISQSKKSNGDHAIDEKSTTKPTPETTTNPSKQQEANPHENGDVKVVDVKESAKAKVGSDEGNVRQGEKVEGGKVKESESEKPKAKIEDVVVEKEKEPEIVIVAEDLNEKSEIVKDEEKREGKIVPSESQSHLYDGNIDGVISEGLSGATVYYSPPRATKEESAKIEDVVVETIEEAKKETTNEEIVLVTEETSIKEEVIPTVETNVAEPEKVVSATEAIVAEATVEEPKANVAGPTSEEPKADLKEQI